MAKSHRRRSHSKARTMRMRGGNGYPPSAWGNVMGTVGNGWTQMLNSLTLQPGQNIATAQSNDIVPIKNLNAQDPQQSMLNLKGGKRRHRSSSRSRARRGGNLGALGAVVNQAIVPGTLLAAQQMYGRRRSKRRG